MPRWRQSWSDSYRNLPKKAKQGRGMVCGRICLADGSIAFMRTGCLSVVPALAAAVRALRLDGADHHLDR